MRTTACTSILAWAVFLTVCSAQPHVADLRSSLASVRAQAAAALGRSGDKSAVPALCDALKDADKDVRREAAKALGTLRDAQAVPALMAALRDSDRNVRFHTASALGEIKDGKAAAALLQALRDPEWCVRDQAAWALREIRSPESIGPLVAALKEKDADVAHVLWLLQQIGGQEAVGHLAPLLRGRDVETRLRAVRALTELQSPATVEPLIAALKDSAPEVRRAAVDALLKVGGERAEKPLAELRSREQDAAIRDTVDKALSRLTRQDALAAHWSFDDKN
ncbi:MAG: HEAT repeat domain-containing protein, partial [Planctomycetes bacterium]|nr:HEAT repeat domain-containing protein [Planctomycetota bacterium]